MIRAIRSLAVVLTVGAVLALPTAASACVRPPVCSESCTAEQQEAQTLFTQCEQEEAISRKQGQETLDRLAREERERAALQTPAPTPTATAPTPTVAVVTPASTTKPLTRKQRELKQCRRFHGKKRARCIRRVNNKGR